MNSEQGHTLFLEGVSELSKNKFLLPSASKSSPKLDILLFSQQLYKKKAVQNIASSYHYRHISCQTLLYHKVQTRSNKGSYYLFLTSCSISWLHSLEKALRSSRVLGASRLYSDWKENASSRDYVYNSCLIL